MNKTLLLLMTLSMAISFGKVSQANEMDDLRKEMKDLRMDYEAKIQTLMERVEGLSKSQKTQIDEMESKVDKKLAGIDIDYVGRYDGAFEKGGLIVRDHSGFGAVTVGGYVDIEFENFQKKTSTFDQHRWIINIGAELGERLKFYSEYEIEHGGPDASGGGEAKVEQAFIDFLIHDAINLRAGALLVPFGRYNLYHDSDLQDLTDRPLVNRDIIPTTWTESGAGIYGEFNPTIGEYEDLQLGYELYFINGLDGGFSDTGLRGARGSIETDNNNNKAMVARIVASPALGHEIGISGYYGDYDGHDNNLAGIGVDFFTSWGPLELVGEWAWFHASESPAFATLAGSGNVANNFSGFYVQANYHFWFDFLNDTFLGRSFENPTFTFVNRFGYAHIEDDFDVGTADNKEHRYTVGINYRPVESWVLKLEYQNNHSSVEKLERGNDEGIIASIAMGF